MKNTTVHFIFAMVVSAYATMFAGCATSEPPHGALSKGSYRPVPAPAQARPGVGLPLPGQPLRAPTVQPQPTPPPVPHTPRTRAEPTIWAGGTPRAKPQPAILGVPIPFGDNLPDPQDWWLTESCGAMMGKAARLVVGDTKLPTALRQCLAAHQYLTCAIAALRADGIAASVGDDNPHRMNVIIETGKTAARFAKHMCPDDIAQSKELKDWADKITAEADRITRGTVQ